MPGLATQLIVFEGHVVFEENPDLVLAAAASAGFTSVETQLKDARCLHARLVAHGLRHAAVHLTPAQLQDPQPWIDYLGITGARDVCNSGLLHWHERTRADHDATAEVLNRAGQAFRSAGIKLHYHNHDFEFVEQPVPGQLSIEYLLSRFDPDAVDLCVDVAWVHRAGMIPTEFIRGHAARIGYLHIKDWDGSNWVPPGFGEVDLASVISTLPLLTRLRWAVCEQDNTAGDPVECIQKAGAWCRQKLNSFS
jgi:sugar phosphate isomerase/epimerase